MDSCVPFKKKNTADVVCLRKYGDVGVCVWLQRRPVIRGNGRCPNRISSPIPISEFSALHATLFPGRFLWAWKSMGRPPAAYVHTDRNKLCSDVCIFLWALEVTYVY